MDTSAAPDFSGTLDFSIFHPLDHAAWEARCRTLPGGPRRHLDDWYAYKCAFRPDDLWARLKCRLGNSHDWQESWHTHRITPAQRAGHEKRPSFYDGAHCRWCGRADPSIRAEECGGCPMRA